MQFVVVFLVAFGLLVVWLAVKVIKAGPRQVSEVDIDRGTVLHRVTRDEPGEGWSELGKKTEARGLDLRFDHDDDPAAQAMLRVPGDADRGTLSHRWTVRLGKDFETHHVQTSGHVFRVRMRGTGSVVGKQTVLLMRVDGDGRPYAGQIENDDDTDAAVGDWIELEFAEVIRLR